MFGKRAQDHTEATHFRSDRVTAINGLFFFSTRENTLEGPFFTRTDAERETHLYVKRMQLANAIRAL
ncbi:hypothetical protein HX870_08970 [Pseudomonas gingeri]|uniref:DUF6316 domain-containing protein n=1 Tax=Pseudomonas gingeri TaxID=117681 RepID=A0A7Y8C0P8_9PSED|nr:DUF6316 family protein [Pseudomonas gingeri]NWA26208.1 hypothetical protein [Pseudomonas gingeri]NWB95133.1 hypothetical protein [Pseudomonas gingeri]NWD67722.1 hypothetical protein [Pseudomonas gingeri]